LLCPPDAAVAQDGPIDSVVPPDARTCSTGPFFPTSCGFQLGGDINQIESFPINLSNGTRLTLQLDDIEIRGIQRVAIFSVLDTSCNVLRRLNIPEFDTSGPITINGATFTVEVTRAVVGATFASRFVSALITEINCTSDGGVPGPDASSDGQRSD
ncbi:hypothetical protein HZC07_00910, partial [Candidatus Micrarchaeota archaeon]|nr:hypothetical protein [Candidatus Micrarchaeota archaeon]